MHLIWSSDIRRLKNKITSTSSSVFVSHFIRFMKYVPVNENHKLISGCYSTSCVVSGSERQRDTSEPHSSSLSIFEQEGMKGTKSAEPKPEWPLWRILFIFVIVKGCQPACTQEPKATQTSRWNTANSAGTLSRDDNKKTLILLKTWPMASFTVGWFSFRHSAGSVSCYSQCKNHWG